MMSMWMSELSQRSDLPVATIKFYLREGLLPAGTPTGATRARYDESHVRRLRLIRALVDVAALRLHDVRAILAAVDNESLPLHEVVGTAHTRLSAGDADAPASTAARERVHGLLRRSRWRLSPGSAHSEALAKALDALSLLDFTVSDDLLDEYAAAMSAVARREVEAVADEAPETATERAVVGTVLLEPVLLTIRRMAHEHVSATKLRRKP
jgi:DNA-binding transcriptional MerR regulator